MNLNLEDPQFRAKEDGRNDGRARSRVNADKWRGTEHWAAYLVAWEDGARPLRFES